MIVSVCQIILLFAISFLIFRKQRPPLRRFYWFAFFAKSLAGICLGLLYIYYYHGDDTIMYFTDARNLAGYAVRDPRAFVTFLWSGDVAPEGIILAGTQPRALFFTKLTTIVVLLTGGNYWVVSLWFSFVSFLSAWYLTSVLHKRFGLITAPIIAFLFFPSVVFWTSGLEKEGIAMAAMYFLTVAFLKLYTKMKLRYWELVLLPLAFWLLWKIKYYFLAAFFPVICTLLIMQLVVRYRDIRNRGVYLLVWFSIFLIPLYIASVVHPNFYPERFLEVIISNHDAFIALSGSDDVIHYDHLSASAIDIVRNFPLATASALFRPFLWEAGNGIQVVAALENTIVMILSLWALITVIRRGKETLMTVTPLAGATLLFVILLAAFLALSTPNFGTLSRYRVGFLPYYILIIIIPLSVSKKFDQRL
jgi:hypothetical protein